MPDRFRGVEHQRSLVRDTDLDNRRQIIGDTKIEPLSIGIEFADSHGAPRETLLGFSRGHRTVNRRDGPEPDKTTVAGRTCLRHIVVMFSTDPRVVPREPTDH